MTEPSLVMAMCTDVFGEVEAEPFVIEDDGDQVRLLKDDGASIAFDRGELAAALGWSDGHTKRVEAA